MTVVVILKGVSNLFRANAMAKVVPTDPAPILTLLSFEELEIHGTYFFNKPSISTPLKRETEIIENVVQESAT